LNGEILFDFISVLAQPVPGGIFSFVFGLLFGSFANVAILRVPNEQSVVKPRSRCPKCEKPIAWFDNIPVLSWLFLRAKCRHCQTPISMRYPLVELITALLFWGVFNQFGFSFHLLELWIFFLGLVIVTFIDFDHFLLPDVFTLPGIALGLAGSFLSSQRTPLDSFLGLLFGGGFLWALAYFYFLIRNEEGMGGGDIKLLAWIGAVLGWQAIPFVIVTSSVTGSVVGVLAALRSDKGLKTMIPFGPYLALGAVLFVFIHSQVGFDYWAWLFPEFVSPPSP
jgi:leader peptidase (prepilin peptidase) / N-methyltransferase